MVHIKAGSPCSPGYPVFLVVVDNLLSHRMSGGDCSSSFHPFCVSIQLADHSLEIASRSDDSPIPVV
eukprot:scaffold29262_cov33-Prasinocladus_malaysianus.AAC.2